MILKVVSTHLSGPWSCDEDISCKIAVQAVLKSLGNKALKNFKQHGKVPRRFNWKTVNSIMKTRSGGQCRERWLNMLSPNINHSDWTQEEDDLLLNLAEKFERKWAIISSHLIGRPPNKCKLRWRHFNRKTKRSSSEAELTPAKAKKCIITNERVKKEFWFDDLKFDFDDKQVEHIINKLSFTEEENEHFEQISRSIHESLSTCHDSLY